MWHIGWNELVEFVLLVSHDMFSKYYRSIKYVCPYKQSIRLNYHFKSFFTQSRLEAVHECASIDDLTKGVAQADPRGSISCLW